MKKLIFNSLFLFTILLILNFTLTINNCIAQWQPDVRLTTDPSGSHTSYNNAWCIAASGDVVHTVWYDGRDGNTEIYYKRSTDGGLSWGADTRLTSNSASSYAPSISVSGQVVHIVWYDNRDGNFEIYYKRSSNGGYSWSADTRLTNDNAYSGYSSVALSGSVVYVVWHDYRDGNPEIYYKRSPDGGLSWGADTRLTNNSAESGQASVTVYGSVVHVTWNDLRDGNWEIYYKRSPDGGISWGADTRLTNNTANSSSSSVSVSSSVVHVVWFDARDLNDEIYYKRSTDGGISWGTDTRLTNNTDTSWIPSITVSGLFVHVVWQDKRDGNWEIYYKRSNNAGVSWNADTRLTNYTSASLSPSVALSGLVVHVVWNDERDGNPEIYYKRNPTGNPTGIQNINSEIPKEYKLEQNYPNPFNPKTNIRFDLSKNCMVKLVVFDALGREVETLVNESLKPGTYEVDWDGGNYTSGVYFYKFETVGFSETKGMVLVK